MRIAFLFLQLLIDHLQASAIGRFWWVVLSIGCTAWVSSASLQYLVG